MSDLLKSNDPALSRREFLTTAAGAGGAMLLGPAWLKGRPMELIRALRRSWPEPLASICTTMSIQRGRNRIRSMVSRSDKRSNRKRPRSRWQTN
jgi:hypothetical protein